MSKRVLTHADPQQRDDQQRDTSPPARRAVAPIVVGAADDHAERDADRVAHEVLDRLAGEAHVHDDCHGELRRAHTGGGAAEVGYAGGELSDQLSGRIEAARGQGRALSGPVRRRMEAGFGRSLAQVRLHTDGEAAELARSVSARAFTTGHDIFFGAGEYSPDTPAGERVLAHEIAHTQQQSGGARRLHRWWDFSQARLDWTKAASLRTVSDRFVWFVADDQGDEMVVKMENQPTGLGYLAGEMHSSLGTAGSVTQKKLGQRDRAWLTHMLQTPSMANHPSFGKFAKENTGFKVPGLGAVTDDNAIEYGRRQGLQELRTSSDNLLAMTKAPGQTAEEMAKPHYGGTGYDPDVSLFRTKLDNPAHQHQLGRITAVDLFLGNTDRVWAGNMGNWFYDPRGAVTLIDHVDKTGMAGSFTTTQNKDYGNGWYDLNGGGGYLANPAQTARDAVGGISAAARRLSKDLTFDSWLDEQVPGGRTRRDAIAAGLEAGIREERARLIKIFTSSRFTVGGSKSRAAKKEFKAIAARGQTEDAGHEKFNGNPTDYYGTLKLRAAWLKKR